MKSFSRGAVQFSLLILLALALFSVAGCSTTSDTENQSTRPWGAPKGWENGALPSSMTEGR